MFEIPEDTTELIFDKDRISVIKGTFGGDFCVVPVA